MIAKTTPAMEKNGPCAIAATAGVPNPYTAPMTEPETPSQPSETCYHCGQPVPPGASHGAVVLGQRRPMCCKGCEAVAEAIVQAGLEDYYRFRTSPSENPVELVPKALRELEVFDDPRIQESFVRDTGDHLREASLILEGITCAACVWLNERHLKSLPGVLDAQINYSTHRALVRWDEQRIRLSRILEAIAAIGYRAHPYDPARQQELVESERRDLLRRLGLAGALGMQVMMIAVALYFGEARGMDPVYEHFFRWVSLLLTAPIVLYSAQPFYTAAWRDLRARTLGMDVPVTLGVFGAFAASAWATVSGGGTIYFESAAMFVFLLLGARFLEAAGRRRALYAVERLAQATPRTATRVTRSLGREREEVIPAIDLRPGDRVRVRPGEPVPADGRVVAGRSSVDESLLTGESRPLPRAAGDPVVGGSLNVESPLDIEVTHVGPDTVLSQILRLLERAQTERPRVAQLANRVAGAFVAVVLLLSAAAGLYWWQAGAPHWLEIAIAVLVVTCPCALSLATPAALTAATGRLAAHGVLATRGDALETLARIRHMAFDKTGTLTEGRPELAGVHAVAASDPGEVLRLAAALERHSEHPLARAIVAAASNDSPPAREVHNTPGAGLEGTIGDERCAVGRPDFVHAFLERHGQTPAHPVPEPPPHATVTWLGSAQRGLLGVLFLRDRLRPGARHSMAALRRRGLQLWLLTGDRPEPAQALAAELGIDRDHVRAGCSPQDKLAELRRLQTAGTPVAMVGDGINDAPVLAGADVSLAMGSGAQLALASADLVLLRPRLGAVAETFDLARRTRRIIVQNLLWALGYNSLALPFAAAGWIHPWMAALGMSASSLVVVANALRLSGVRPAIEET